MELGGVPKGHGWILEFGAMPYELSSSRECGLCF
jgi:hypothetical protein